MNFEPFATDRFRSSPCQSCNLFEFWRGGSIWFRSNNCGFDFDLKKEKRKKDWVISDSRFCPFLKWSISIAQSLSASSLINHLSWRIQFVLRISVRNWDKSITFRRIGEPLVHHHHHHHHRIPFRFHPVIDLDRQWLMLWCSLLLFVPVAFCSSLM